MNLHARAHACLMTADPGAKCRCVEVLLTAWRGEGLALGAAGAPEAVPVPGRPERPLLVPPREVPSRGRLHAPEGRAALLHALAHIEFNAINLALDAVYRFRGLPRDFYDDWLGVAEEEALHFRMLAGLLARHGFAYGDFPAHDGLWQMAVETAFDPLVRMALVPRLLEARGLDATPAIIARLRAVGDGEAAQALERIRADEVGHVAAGSRWFRHLCTARGLEPEAAFRDLLARHFRGRFKGPFAVAERLAAGFSADEIAWIEAQAHCQKGRRGEE